MGIKFGNGTEWKLNLRHHGNGIGNGNELMGMGGNGNVASHSRTSLQRCTRTVSTALYSVHGGVRVVYTGRVDGHVHGRVHSPCTQPCTLYTAEPHGPYMRPSHAVV